MKTLHLFLWLCLYSRFSKKNNLPWSNQVFHEIFQLTVWVPLQWLEEDSKERQHEDQPLQEKQRLSWKGSDFDKVRREIVCRGNVLLISYRSKSLYLRLYICATQIEGTSCVAHKFNMFNFILQKMSILTLKYRHLVGLAHHLFSCVYSKPGWNFFSVFLKLNDMKLKASSRSWVTTTRYIPPMGWSACLESSTYFPIVLDEKSEIQNVKFPLSLEIKKWP